LAHFATYNELTLKLGWNLDFSCFGKFFTDSMLCWASSLKLFVYPLYA